MKHIFEVNARTTELESAETKHNFLINSLRSVMLPWGIDRSDVPFPGFGKDSLAVINLNKFVGKGLKFTTMYQYRNMLLDQASYDDRIYIELDSKKIDYSDLVNNIAHEYVSFFKGYSAFIYPEKVIFEDFEKSRNVNRRNTIIRFNPINFIDETLCNRALGMSCIMLSDKISSLVEKVSLIHGGIYIIASSKPMSLDECNHFDESIKKAIGIM